MADPDTKVCVVCGRPFANRKRWSSRGQWDEVRYCSRACRSRARRERRSPGSGPTLAPASGEEGTE